MSFLSPKITIFAAKLFIKMQRILLSLFITFFSINVCQAQFRAMRDLSWYPKSGQNKSYNSSNANSSSVLEDLNNAFNAGNYRDVVFTYYPQAIKGGYQRNSLLYNNTRRALRQLMRDDPSLANWRQMQALYQERIKNLGSDEYDYRNNLETTSWCEEQLLNERLAALASMNDRYQDCYKVALERVQKASGKIDLAVILQGMFAPLNRAHVANPDLGSSLDERYQEILGFIDQSERFMEQEHRQDYMAYYPSTIIDQVRSECLRVININKAKDRAAAREEQEQAATAYSQALNYYRQKDYNNAFNAAGEGWRKYQTPEFRILRSNILQNCANEASSTADRVAFLCAAYEAGHGYVSRQTINHILEGLRANLFMSGVAGKTHRTTRNLIINQRIWTVDELKEKSSN